MTYRFVQVRRYKRGAIWPDGKPRMCILCGSGPDERARRRRATVIAIRLRSGSKSRLPVAYCAEHDATREMAR